MEEKDTNQLLADLIHKGGIIKDAEGSTAKEVYANVCKMMNLPDSMNRENLYNALCAREDILSTAVGNAIALPHARAPIMKDDEEQRIVVVYLKEPIDMSAPDERKVSTMFILLTSNSQTHLKVLSGLVEQFRKPSFRKLLENKATEVQLLNEIKELDK